MAGECFAELRHCYFNLTPLPKILPLVPAAYSATTFLNCFPVPARKPNKISFPRQTALNQMRATKSNTCAGSAGSLLGFAALSPTYLNWLGCLSDRGIRRFSFHGSNLLISTFPEVLFSPFVAFEGRDKPERGGHGFFGQSDKLRAGSPIGVPAE